MQHHGAPTRLLDFTYSIYIAAYFAIEHADSDCAIWAVNSKWSLDESIKILRKQRIKNAPKLRKPYHEDDDLIVNDTLRHKRANKCSAIQTPFRLNERLRVQHGTFMFPSRVDETFEKNLQALPGWDRDLHVKKLILPEAFRRKAIVELFNMGISRRSLFPGLDGYAASLAVYTPLVGEKRWESEAVPRRNR